MRKKLFILLCILSTPLVADWIPGDPEKTGDYMITFQNDTEPKVFMDTYIKGYGWKSFNHWNITAHQILPKPYIKK